MTYTDNIDKEFPVILKYIEENTGILLPETHYRYVKQFLDKKISQFNIGIKRYICLLETDRVEYENFINAITINETYFFREEKQFKTLESYILPEFYKKNLNYLKIWSAAASSGEESFSLAALIYNFFKTRNNKNFTILASDINTRVLMLLNKAKYSGNSFRKDGSCFHHLLKSYGHQNHDGWTPAPYLKEKVSAKLFNLSRDNYNEAGHKFHIIFFRNTLIYIKQEIREKIIQNLVSKLHEDGYLFLASAETPLVSHPELKLLYEERVYFFKKKNLKDKKRGYSINHEKNRLTVKKVRELPSRVSPDIGKLKTSELCYLINARLNNNLFKSENPLKTEISIDFIEVIRLINNRHLKKAEELLKRIENYTGENEILLYFYGYLKTILTETRSGESFFNKALILNSEFWIARYYLGKIQVKQEPLKARRNFMVTIKHIEKYIDEKRYDYQFLLEGFNARYFLDICNKLVKDLGSRHGYR